MPCRAVELERDRWRETDRLDAVVFDLESEDEPAATVKSPGIGGGSREMVAWVWVELEEGLRVISAVGRDVGGGTSGPCRVDDDRLGPTKGDGRRSSPIMSCGEVVRLPTRGRGGARCVVLRTGSVLDL